MENSKLENINSNYSNKMVRFEVNGKYQDNTTQDKHKLYHEDELKKTDSIRDALEKSSLHGVSQIIGKQLFVSRRLIWSVIFIASGCIFMVQFVLSAERYLSKPVSVDVKINYNESIIFPAVTICNSNAFRLSSAYEKGYYNIITKMFGTDEEFVHIEKTVDFKNITMEELYLETGQLKEDFITRWEGSPCKMEDFVMILTDFGLCFSFNTGENGAELYRAYTTGSGGGLSLQVNIEQYEYMQGPNKGAGLKVLIHDNAKTTLVKDNALAIPPGTHSFIASKITQVNYLKPDYGICNDSVSLDFFTKFTMENCYSNCMENFFISRCGCRDFYMPSLYANFSSVRQYCDCPIPCHLLMHEPVLSFAAKSNFDIAGLLKDEKMVTNLKHKFVTAREISEKVDNTKIDIDKKIIISYINDLNRFQDGIYVMIEKIEKVVLKEGEVNKDIIRRLDFHIRRMLTDLKNNVQENFIYNFEKNTMRSFGSLTSDLDGYVELFTKQLNGTGLSDTTHKRWLTVLPMYSKILEKKELIESSKNDIKQVYKSYRTATRKTKKVISHKRHYDKVMAHKSFISLSSQGSSFYQKLKKLLDKMELALDMCLAEADIYIFNGTIDTERIKMAQLQFEKQQRFVNQNIFKYQYNVVQRPLQFLEKLEFRLYGYNTTIGGNHEQLLRQVKEIQSTITVLIYSKLSDLVSLSYISSSYSNNKTWLAEQVTLAKINKMFMQLNIDMVSMVAVVKNIQRELRSLVSVHESVWKVMIESPFTQNYYKKIYEDAQIFPTLNSSSEEFEYYSNVLLYTVEHLYDFNTTYNSTLTGNITVEDFLRLLVNTDIHRLEIKDVLFEVNELFRNFSLEFAYMYEISTIFEELTNSYNTFHNQMKQFLDGNIIDEDFFLANFMRIDIYMQELRYEEITQQKAYDAIKLFSDIGGSMGLFIGGSLLSLVEFVDIFIYRWMLKSCRDKKTK